MNYLSGDKNAANQNKSQNPKNKDTLQRKGKTLMPPNAQRVLQLKEMVANSFQSKIAQRNALQNQYLNSAEGQRVQQLKSMIANSPQMQRAAQLQAMANNYAARQQTPIQRVGKEEEELVQGKFKPPFPIQRKKNEEELVQGKFKPPFSIQRKKNEEELLQGKFKPDSTVQRKTSEEELVQGKFEQETPVQRQANNTGLPDNLKSGIENLSGYSMDDVKVHYNSNKPAQLQAHAYAQGMDIHLGSGQEKHLPHEAWHVVQQKQGRVKPTMQMKGKVNINDDKGLEREADVMGAKALQSIVSEKVNIQNSTIQNKTVIQRLKQDAIDYISHFGQYTQTLGTLLNVWNNRTNGQVTKNNIIAFCQTTLRANVRQALIDAWNKNQTNQYYIGTPNGITHMGVFMQSPQETGFSRAGAKEAMKNNLPNWGQANHNAGVTEGMVGAYDAVQWQEKVNDGLTGDHQPSGAANKQHIHDLLSLQTNNVTRTGLDNAYQKSNTVVVDSKWHQQHSRTFGGRNIKKHPYNGQNLMRYVIDAKNLGVASMEDFKKLIPHLQNRGLSNSAIQAIWDKLRNANDSFFKTGKPQSLK
ncbi:MAG: DUF4157 domain-containing protein [Chitinophagales bacterium]